VVNVRDDGDISNVLHRFQNSRIVCLLCGKGQAKREGKFNCRLSSLLFNVKFSEILSGLVQ
jgi:hypothetical protein